MLQKFWKSIFPAANQQSINASGVVPLLRQIFGFLFSSIKTYDTSALKLINSFYRYDLVLLLLEVSLLRQMDLMMSYVSFK